MLTSDRAYVCPCFDQRLASARLSAHSRYRAFNRRLVQKRRRVSNRRQVLTRKRVSLVSNTARSEDTFDLGQTRGLLGGLLVRFEWWNGVAGNGGVEWNGDVVGGSGREI